MQKVMSFNNIALVYIGGVLIEVIFMRRDDAINIMNGSILLDKRGVL